MIEKEYLEVSRIPVFIGKAGGQKRIFEKTFNCKIEVNSSTGEVLIDSEDATNSFVLKNVILAINYGHSPEHALRLEDESYVLDVIDVKNYISDHKRLKVVMGRIIGKEGATRRIIEEITKCSVSVKDHYVSVIGPFENTVLVHDALDMLIKGASHKTLYGYLEKNKQDVSKGFY